MDSGLIDPYAQHRERSPSEEEKKKRARVVAALALALFFAAYFCYLNIKLHSAEAAEKTPAEEVFGEPATTTAVASVDEEKNTTSGDSFLAGFPIKGFCLAYKRCLLKAASRPVPAVGEKGDFLCEPAARCDFTYLRCNAASESRAVCRSRSYFYEVGPMGNLVRTEGVSLAEVKLLIAACDHCSSKRGAP